VGTRATRRWQCPTHSSRSGMPHSTCQRCIGRQDQGHLRPAGGLLGGQQSEGWARALRARDHQPQRVRIVGQAYRTIGDTHRPDLFALRIPDLAGPATAQAVAEEAGLGHCPAASITHLIVCVPAGNEVHPGEDFTEEDRVGEATIDQPEDLSLPEQHEGQNSSPFGRAPPLQGEGGRRKPVTAEDPGRCSIAGPSPGSTHLPLESGRDTR
jgi:hypothetical protein